jgi:hypothetical protein
VKILKKYRIPHPDVIICSVGSALFYGTAQEAQPGMGQPHFQPMEPG